MKKDKHSEKAKTAGKPAKKRGNASQGDSSRTQKGDPAEKAKGKAEGRK